MVTKLGRMVTYLIGSHPMKLLDALVKLIARSCDKLLLDHVTLYLHCYIVYIITKLRRVVPYLEAFLSLHLHDPLIMWPCLINRQTKNIILYY